MAPIVSLPVPVMTTAELEKDKINKPLFHVQTRSGLTVSTRTRADIFARKQVGRHIYVSIYLRIFVFIDLERYLFTQGRPAATIVWQ